MCGKPSADPKSWIEDVILNFIEQSPENTLQGPFQEKSFENPLVGFANGADPIFDSYCLFFSKGICGRCIARCPVGALSEKGHDKLKCLQHLRPASADYVKEHYGFDGYGCGLCQTGVPCESKMPTEEDV